MRHFFSFPRVSTEWLRPPRAISRNTRSCLLTDSLQRIMNTSSIRAVRLTPHPSSRTGGTVEEETTEAGITGIVGSPNGPTDS